MDKSDYKWVYAVGSMRKDSTHTQWVYDVDHPEEGVEQVWLVDEEFYNDHYKFVDWVWFVDASKLDNPYIKKVYVAGYDTWYAQQSVQNTWPNLPRKLRRR